MKIVLIYLCILSIVFDTHAQDKAAMMDSLLGALYNRGQFNGGILVSVHGKVIYKKSYGKANLQTGADFTPSTPCCLASVSKQFTAMAIMMLQQKGQLGLDDPISKYLPDLPAWGQTVSIKHLLNHTSGIINYEQLGVDHPGVTNSEIFRALARQTSLRFNPGDKYEYSNSGYVLLAMIVEKVSGMTFSEFMEKEIFEPLKMTNSYIYDTSTAKSKNRAIGYGKFDDINDIGGYAVGDAGIFSTVEDLYKWDKALYTNKLVNQSTLNKAFVPAILNNGTQSQYGFGWMLKNEKGEQIVYHTGGSGGFRTYIERQLTHHNTIIILTNMENSPRREIRDAIVNILDNNPYQLPPISIATEMYTIRNEKGIDSAIAFYKSNKLSHKDRYDYGEQELNLLGYKLWSINQINEAIEIFKLNVSAYPASSNTYESLGEAYLKRGDKQLAAESFNKSLSIDPQNSDAARMLKQIK